MSDGQGSLSRIGAAEFEAMLRATIPLADVFPLEVVSLAFGEAELRMSFREAHLRAGGTVNGPALMTLADTALYAAVLSRVGMEPLAVTSDLSIHFLRKPAPGPLRGRATILRQGRRLAVGTITITSEVDGEVVAHATGSYALPPRG